jgi:hypothetical protein
LLIGSILTLPVSHEPFVTQPVSNLDSKGE